MKRLARCRAVWQLEQRGLPGLARAFTSHTITLESVTSHPSPRSRLLSAPKPFHEKLLIANRGEVACRVIRTAKRLGVRTVAIYSEADANALHVKLADEAYCVGPALSKESYLNVKRIIDVCKRSGATAVHPGWGFLSENAGFADALLAQGIAFVGPPSDAIRAMGSKSESKEIMLAAKVPCIPGYHGVNQEPDFLHGVADEMGYPVLIKAIKGGGGKGMRVVHHSSEFREMLSSSKREAIKSFDDDAVLVEKYVTKPRHIEVQIFADEQGSTVHLYERDCSIQRRHQKVIEEAPAPNLSEASRRELGAMAVRAAQAVGYVGAGTVETLYDEDSGEFYFMEMNTRLQVEHPVSEMITGLDFVEWQLSIAAGNPLPLSQSEIPCSGHAFEARIYAENPRAGFLPDVGPLTFVKTPLAGADLRLETGFVQGDEISVHYDPMISKLVVWGSNRADALSKFSRALAEYRIAGLNTNIEFLRSVVRHPAFEAAKVETGFIPKYVSDLLPSLQRPSYDALAMATISVLARRQAWDLVQSAHQAEPYTPFSLLRGARIGSVVPLTTRHVTFHYQGTLSTPETYTVSMTNSGSSSDLIISDSTGRTAGEYRNVRPLEHDPTTFSAHLHDKYTKASVVAIGLDPLAHTNASEKIVVFMNGTEVELMSPKPSYLLQDQGAMTESSASVRTPMPCKVVSVSVASGDIVKAGQVLVVLEAMKMEYSIRAPRDGRLTKVLCKSGEMLPEGRDLVEYEAILATSTDVPLSSANAS